MVYKNEGSLSHFGYFRMKVTLCLVVHSFFLILEFLVNSDKLQFSLMYSFKIHVKWIHIEELTLNKYI